MEDTLENTPNNKKPKAIKKKREPIFHVVKKSQTPLWQSFVVKFIALIIAFIVSALFLGLTNGVSFGRFFLALFSTFENNAKIFLFLKDYVILLGLSIALIPAFKMKFWNTGADGQALIGGLVSYLIAYSLQGKMPNILIVVLCILAAVLAGALFGVIPAIFKAFFNTNETLFTLMQNYVAIQLVLIACHTIGAGNNGNLFYLTGGVIEQLKFGTARLALFAILSIVLIFVVVAIYLSKTKHGFEIGIIGESVNTAKYVGINVKLVLIRTMAISGGICGFVGFLVINATGSNILTAQSIGGLGFTAIIVAWLANSNPFYTLLSTFLVVFITNGTKNLSLPNASAPSVVIAIFFFFIIGLSFFASYKLVARRNEKGEIDNPIAKFMHIITYYPSRFMDKLFTKIGNFFNYTFKNIVKKDHKDPIEELPKDSYASLDINEKSSDAEIGTNDEVHAFSNINLDENSDSNENAAKDKDEGFSNEKEGE